MKILNVILIGIGGTLTMDLWGQILKLFGIKGLNLGFLGRWILTVFDGKWFHEKIAMSPEKAGELYVGWLAHYVIGISFAVLLISLYGFQWLENPRIQSALVIGLVTVLAPLLIMQPALGLGYFSSKTAHPGLYSLKSVASHLAYGIGLYVTAIVLRKIAA
jgi:hypothetical protein